MESAIFERVAETRKAMMDSYPGKTERGKMYNAVKLTEDQRAWFCENYPKMKRKEIAKAMDVSVSWVGLRAREWGLITRHRRGLLALPSAYGEDYKTELERLRILNIKRKIKRMRKMERFRIASGIALETKWHTTLRPFNSRQTSLRHDALKRGYWYYQRVPESNPLRWNIYYDSKTNRSERFERRIRNNGFNLVEDKEE